MTALGLMNQLNAIKYLAKFNSGLVKELLSGSEPEYDVNPRFIAIIKEKTFAGDDPDEDPYTHLMHFTELCCTLKLRGYSDVELKLKLFSQYLTNTALAWYRICHADKIDTWEKLKGELVVRFFPKVKT